MTIEDDIAFLERIPILRRLGAAGAAHPRHRRRKLRDLEPGEVLFAAGDLGRRRLRRAARFVQSAAAERAGEADVIAGPGTLLGEIGAAGGNAAPGHRARRARMQP